MLVDTGHTSLVDAYDNRKCCILYTSKDSNISKSYQYNLELILVDTMSHVETKYHQDVISSGAISIMLRVIFVAGHTVDCWNIKASASALKSLGHRIRALPAPPSAAHVRRSILEYEE